MKKLLSAILLPPLLFTACHQDKNYQTPTVPEVKESKAENPFSLLLSFAQFQNSTDGKIRPGLAKMVVLHREGRNWRPETVIDEESVVFHKAYCRNDGQGHPGIVTIGATSAILKYWQRDENGRLAGKKWYQGDFGGQWNRLRDIEEGDVDGDGRPEQIIVTHDQGVIVVGEYRDNSWQNKEIYRKADTFIHEVEIGDLDGDKKPEFFATPSDPNKMNVSQDGQVIRGRYNSTTGNYDIDILQKFENRHAKEILVYDFDGDGRDELYVSLEAQLDKEGKEISPLEILQLEEEANGKINSRTIAVLSGRQARVLTPVHLDGAEKPARLLVTTLNGGVLLLTPNGQEPWPAKIVDADSQGFEHAALAADSDGDGHDEIFVVADKQGTVSQYVYKNGQFYKRVIMRIAKQDLVWNITACSGEQNP